MRLFSRRATASPGRAERWGVWGAISGPLTSIAAISGPPMVWADHPGALRSEGWTPLTAALVFGGLALLAGMVVIVIVTVLTRRDDESS
jgi:Na+(H+)/acetate symporter ActP